MYKDNNSIAFVTLHVGEDFPVYRLTFDTMVLTSSGRGFLGLLWASLGFLLLADGSGYHNFNDKPLNDNNETVPTQPLGMNVWFVKAFNLSGHWKETPGEGMYVHHVPKRCIRWGN
jgi:hypothetical protein